MIIPCDPILCFYLLLGQRYIVDNNPQFTKPKEWFETRELITNDTIFSLDDIYKKLDIETK